MTESIEQMATVRQITTDDDLLDEILEQIGERLKNGDNVNVGEYTQKYPHLADGLQRLVPGIQALAALGYATKDASAASGRPAPLDADEPEGGTLGDFRILREIGRGGMGVVYEAEQFSLKRRVALKVLPFAAVLDPRQLQRFKNEALAAAQLEHPHIVPVHGVGCERGVHHYAMRFIEGQTLAAVIAELRRASGLEQNGDASRPQSRIVEGFLSGRDAVGFGPLDPTVVGKQGSTVGPAADQRRAGPVAALSGDGSASSREFFRSAARLGRDAAAALDYAHEHGVIHRDIKPSNLMLDAAGKVWITDFGLAHIETDASLTMSGDLLGTLRYMSPEQVLAKRVVIDHRTDIYSLGVTLYELLTLQPAYPETDRQQLLQRISFDDPTPPRQLNADIPVDLETIVLKATAKNPQERYETAQDMADDLQRYLDNEPIRARRPTIIQRANKWTHRHPAIVTSALLVLFVSTLALSVSTAVILSAYQREASANQLAADESQRAGEALRNADLARTEADHQRQQAQDNLLQALESVDRMLTRVSEEQLFSQPKLTRVRQKILEDAAEQLSSLSRNQQDARLLRATHSAYSNLAKILFHQNNRTDALEQYLKALDIAKTLASRPDAGDEDLHRLANSYGGLGNMQWIVNDQAAAEECLNQAMTLLRRLRDREPADPQYRLTQMWVLVMQGQLASRRDQAILADDTYRRASQMAEQLVMEFPSDPAYRLAWARQQSCQARDGTSLDSEERLELLDHSLHLVKEALPQFERSEPGVRPLIPKMMHLPAPYYCRCEIGTISKEMGHIQRLLGHTASAEDHYRESIRAYESIIADFPDMRLVKTWLGEAYAGLCRLMLQTGRASEAKARLEKLASSGMGGQELADLLIEIGLYDTAIAVLNELLENTAGGAEDHLYKRRGACRMILKDYEGALADLRQAVELSPSDGFNLSWLGWQALQDSPADIQEEYLALADRAVVLTDGDADSYYMRAGLNVALGRSDQAVADFNTAIERSADSDNAYHRYCRALLLLDRNDVEGFQSECQTTLDLFADTMESSTAHWTAWTCALGPDSVATLDEAVTLAKLAVDLEPSDEMHRACLGAVLYRAGRVEEAVETLNEHVREWEPQSVPTTLSPAYTWFFLAMAHHHLGHHAEAQDYLTKASERAHEELQESPTWNRVITLRLLQHEAEEVLPVGLPPPAPERVQGHDTPEHSSEEALDHR